jgi:alkylation response protein AidB-like acyl-CoA dehydrogenase
MSEEGGDDDILRMLLYSAVAFLRDAHSLQRVRELRDESSSVLSFDRAMWRRMAENGWLGICLPEAMGGAGLNVAAAAELAALFGAALLPEPFAMSAVAPSSILATLAESPVRTALARSLCDGSKVFTLAWQDTIGQMDAGWGPVTMVAECDGFRLKGRKVFVDDAATDWFVTAVHGATPVVVALSRDAMGAPGASSRLADGSRVVSAEFDGAWVGAGAVLLRGEQARVSVGRALDDARLVTAALLAGMAGRAIDLSADYVAQRMQFGVPIGSFQVIRHRLVDLDLQRRLSFASWRHAAKLEITGDSDRQSRSSEISAAKARCSQTALLAARSAIQLHGAMGYTQEADIGLFMNAALRHASALGNAPAHRRRFLQRGMLAHRVA